MNYPNFLVRIGCLTYNHAPYIEDAMNGFCMQETTFPFVATIIDDASTDGEQEVIKKYLDENFDFSENSVSRKWETDDAHFIYAQHKENKNCYFAVVLLKYNFYSIKKAKGPLIREWTDTKYVALCEGDDYWVVKSKLQEQIQFLEHNLAYTMCFHRAQKKYEVDVVNNIKCEAIEDRDYGGSEVFDGWIVPTASIVCRTKVLAYKTKGNNRILFGDIVLILKCAEVGKIRGMSNLMSVYRINANSITNRTDKVREMYFNMLDHWEFIFDNFSVESARIKKEMGHRFYERALEKKFHSEYWLNDIIKSLRYTPIKTSLLVLKSIKSKIGRTIDRRFSLVF